jgi:hypothetical protein
MKFYLSKLLVRLSNINLSFRITEFIGLCPSSGTLKDVLETGAVIEKSCF